MCVTALLLAIGACAVALRSLVLYRSSSSARQSARLSDIESTIEELSSQLKRTRAAMNMRAYRQRKADAEQAETAPAVDDADAVRRDLNRQLALGQMKGPQ